MEKLPKEQKKKPWLIVYQALAECQRGNKLIAMTALARTDLTPDEEKMYAEMIQAKNEAEAALRAKIALVRSQVKARNQEIANILSSNLEREGQEDTPVPIDIEFDWRYDARFYRDLWSGKMPFRNCRQRARERMKAKRHKFSQLEQLQRERAELADAVSLSPAEHVTALELNRSRMEASSALNRREFQEMDRERKPPKRVYKDSARRAQMKREKHEAKKARWAEERRNAASNAPSSSSHSWGTGRSEADSRSQNQSWNHPWHWDQWSWNSGWGSRSAWADPNPPREGRKGHGKGKSKDPANRDSHDPYAHGVGLLLIIALLLACAAFCWWIQIEPRASSSRGVSPPASPLSREDFPKLRETLLAFGDSKKWPEDQDSEGNRHVGGRSSTAAQRKRVKFKDGDPTPGQAYPSLNHLKGPNEILKEQANLTGHLTLPQNVRDYQAERLGLVLDRMAESTRKTYNSQFKWWELFCKRRGLDPLRVVSGPNVEEENLVLDFIIHSGIEMGKSPGTVKLRIAAMRSRHLTLGLPDPLYYMPRVPLALSGLRRRWGTPERRLPVTPEMLRWLRRNLKPQGSSSDSLVWAAVMLGFFFLLRASEYLDVGYQTPHRGMLGRHVQLLKEGRPWRIGDAGDPDEVHITIQGSKTDIYNQGQSRNHFRVQNGDGSLGDLCVVQALQWFFMHFPDRQPGSVNQDLPLLTESNGHLLPREALQTVLQMAARALGFNEARLGSHSLRFGGASALWAAFHDAAIVRRWGRWASDAFQTYIWEGRQGAKGVAKAMSEVDLTPS